MPKREGSRLGRYAEPGAGMPGAGPSNPRPGRVSAVLCDDERALLSLSDSLGDGAAILDAEGRIKGVNKRLIEILGIPERRIIGKRLDLVRTFHGQGVSEKLSGLLLGREAPPFDLETASETGQPLSLRMHLVHVARKGNGTSAAAVIRDISPLRQMERQWQAIDERNRLFVENAEEGVVVVQDGVVVFLNQKAADLSGRPVEDCLSKSFLQDVHPADKALVVEMNLRRMRGEPVPRFYSFRVACLNGAVRWAEVNAVEYIWDGRPALISFVRDITERKEAEERLRESEERYRLLAENASDVIWVIDSQLNFTYASPSVTRLLGYRLDEIVNHSFQHLLTPDSLAAMSRAFTADLAGETARPGSMKEHTVEFEAVCKDGATVWMEAAIAPVRNEEGRLAGFQGACRAVTDRRRDRERLEESERRYRLLAENVSDVIWVTDMNMHPTYLSPSIEQLLGYTVRESMSHTMDGMLTPASAEAVRRTLERVVEKGRQLSSKSGAMELELKRKDGSTVWVQSTLSFIPGPDGKPVEIMGVMRDVSKRRLAEEALREAKAKLDLLLQQMPCLCWTTDRDLRFTSCAGALIGASRFSQLIGTNLSAYYGKKDDTPLRAHRQALAGTTDSYEVEGGGRAFYCRVEPLRDAGNDLVGVVGAAVDITAYKNLVSQLRTLSRRLISVQEDERRAIASELHDEVGQSLTALRLLLEKAQGMAARIDNRQLAVATGVVNELMSRVREMSLDLRPAMLDDLGLLPTLLWHFRRYTDHTQVKVKFRHGGLRKPLPPEVSIAAYRIVQEALTNVARYAKVNEVSVCVRAERGVVLVEVADHGVGFDEAKLGSQPSSGLRGMRERALALDGKFTVKSVPGRGTYVMAELPCGAASEKGKEE